MSYPHSVTSDAASLASAATFTTTPPFVAQVKPAPEYISLSSASQLATDVADACAEEDSTWRRTNRAAVSETAVALVNAFLDRQLFEIINVARTTNLAVLKPAVTEVLKKSLARDAIASAQENLEDLLALQADDDSGDTPRPSSQSGAKWNLEFTWKRSRLRVMMRTEKSEFDIDDDERYVREESLNTTFSETAGVISLASEIFLAGVLDYLGEMLLALATQLAIARAQRRGSTTSVRSADGDEVKYILVQDTDLEKAVLNSALDRQWRAWRKSLRSLQRSSQQSSSASHSPIVPRRGSLFDRVADQPENHYPEHVLAANIPLPSNQGDADEIETSGLSKDADLPFAAYQARPGAQSTRPQSASIDVNRQGNSDHEYRRMRPFSVPTPIATPFVDAPGAWPGATPIAEAVDSAIDQSSNLVEKDAPSVVELDCERPESKDSAHTEKMSIASRSSSLEDRVPSLRTVQRPKRLAIYGPASSRYTQAFNLTREDVDAAIEDPMLSPRDFLASRNLGGSSSAGATPTSEEDRNGSFHFDIPSADEAQQEEDEVETYSEHGSETDDEALIGTAVSSPNIERSSLPSPLARQFPGLGLSRSGSDASSRRTPISEQRVSADFLKSRRTSKLTDSDPNSPGKRGSLRQIISNRESLDERKRLPNSTLTSEQEFDLLLKSDETVKYTLTPETVRDVPDRPFSPHIRVQKQALFRSGSRENLFKKQADSDTQSVRSMRSSTWSIGGSKDKKDTVLAEESKRKTSISRPAPQNTSALPSGHVAREPVMHTESTRDFADFIRSTGPDKEQNPVIPMLASRSMSSLRATAAAQAAPPSSAQPPLPKPPGSSGGKYIPRSPLSPPPKRPANRLNLMAREATGSTDSNNDLIDFIRSGPPGAGGKGRVPNHIAPFADVDDEDGADLRTVITGASDMPRSSASIYNRPLTASTSNSRTGLLPNGSGHFGYSNSPKLPTSPLTQSSRPSTQSTVANVRSGVSSDAQRKQTRIKDPYAIPDDSDDEEDVLSALPGDRLDEAAGANHAGAGTLSEDTSMHSSAGHSSPSLTNGQTPTLSQGSLLGSPNPGYDPSIRSVLSTTSTSAIRPAHITSQISSSGYVPRSNKPKMEVRSAGVVKNARLDPFHSSGTSDLADFLKSSGPPEPPSRIPEPAPSPTIGVRGKGEKNEKKKPKFWQRKATYLDMP